MSKQRRQADPQARSSDNAAEAPRLEERLHKVLAQAGLGSRRALEQRIADGLVKVNGEVAQVGMSVTGGDKIEIDGKHLRRQRADRTRRVLIYNKPEGEVTTREDPEGRPTIFEALPALKGARWIAIGRLDINTTGLLLLTTDGELANAMMHPSLRDRARIRLPRARAGRRRARVGQARRPPARGVALEDGPAKFDEIERIGGTRFARLVPRAAQGRPQPRSAPPVGIAGLPGQPPQAHPLRRRRTAAAAAARPVAGTARPRRSTRCARSSAWRTARRRR